MSSTLTRLAATSAVQLSACPEARRLRFGLVPYSPRGSPSGRLAQIYARDGARRCESENEHDELEPPVWGSWAGPDAVTLSQSMQAIRRSLDRSHHAGDLDFRPDICLNAWAATMSEVLRPKSRQDLLGRSTGDALTRAVPCAGQEGLGRAPRAARGDRLAYTVTRTDAEHGGRGEARTRGRGTRGEARGQDTRARRDGPLST
jgi:hypothetical protein